ncbi:hypothetical protein MMC13_005143 [Lambiella insularis]|nr:hypothetical protein [Lambiella insularis]
MHPDLEGPPDPYYKYYYPFQRDQYDQGAGYSQADADHPLCPDALLLLYRRRLHTLSFAPFGISEGKVAVEHVLKMASHKIGVSRKHLKLTYNGQALNDEKVLVKDLGLRMNSVVACKVEGKGGSSERVPKQRGGGDKAEGAGPAEEENADQDG